MPVPAFFPWQDQHRPDGLSQLWAVSGYSAEPEPPDIHVHRGLEAGVLLAGVEEVHFSNTVLTCCPGDVWLCNVFEPHGAQLVSGPRRSVVLIFLPGFLGEELVGGLPWLTLFAAPPDARPRATTAELRNRLLSIGQAMRWEIEQKRPHWESVVRLELLRLLIELARSWEAAELPSVSGRALLRGMARLMPALTLVHTVPWRRVSVPEAAAACGLSVSRFHALFRQTMGIGFAHFSLRARLSLAAHRLLNSDRPLETVAAEVGFADKSHLHRRFVEHYGCTPSQFRERRELRLAPPRV